MPAAVRDWVSHIWRRLDRSGRCWVWTGARHPFGYGEVRIGNKLQRLHRLMYEWTWGEIPEGQVVRHTCDNPSCCNPAHLLIGTQRENLRDMVSRGRFNHWRANRTHCRRGHAYDAENTVWERDGSRTCRECRNALRRKPNGRGPRRRRILNERAA